MRTVILCVLIYLKMSDCLYHQQRVHPVNYELYNLPKIENYPWIVIISKISTQEIISFGSLIHPSVVLAHASLDAYSSNFDFQVLGKCFFNYHNLSVMSSYECKKSRNIKEYSVTEVDTKESDYYWQNLAVLILSEPFILTSNINIISLAKDQSDFDPHLCSILYLMLIPNSSKEPMFDFSTQIKYEENYPKLQINWLDLENKYLNHVNSLDLRGSPVICRTKHEGGHWVLAFLLHISIEKDNITNIFNHYSVMRDITYFHKTEIIDTIIRNSGFSI